MFASKQTVNNVWLTLTFKLGKLVYAQSLVAIESGSLI